MSQHSTVGSRLMHWWEIGCSTFYLLRTVSSTRRTVLPALGSTKCRYVGGLQWPSTRPSYHVRSVAPDRVCIKQPALQGNRDAFTPDYGGGMEWQVTLARLTYTSKPHLALVAANKGLDVGYSVRLAWMKHWP